MRTLILEDKRFHAKQHDEVDGNSVFRDCTILRDWGPFKKRDHVDVIEIDYKTGVVTLDGEEFAIKLKIGDEIVLDGTDT